MDRTELDRIEAIDRQNAFELGFFKAAQDAGLNSAQYDEMRKLAEEVPTFTKSPAPSEGGDGSMGRFPAGTKLLGSRPPSMLTGDPGSLGRVVGPEPKPTPGVQVPSKPNLSSIFSRAYQAGGFLPNLQRGVDLAADAMTGSPRAKAEANVQRAENVENAHVSGVGRAMDRGVPAEEDAARANMNKARVARWAAERAVPPAYTTQVENGVSKLLNRTLAPGVRKMQGWVRGRN
jgi:hypothetical protein